MKGVLCWAVAGLQPLLSAALTIAEINGNRYISSYNGKTVSDVTGLVTAKSSAGIYIRSTTPDDDEATSDSIYVFSSTIGRTVDVGDIINLGSAKVSEYRSSNTYMYLTELTNPSDITVVSSNNAVTPLIIGKDTLSPPTEQFTSLDEGDIYSVPNAQHNISAVNPVLKPAEYGLDFWESLTGELVTVKAPTALKIPSSYRDTWVIGDWKVTGKNDAGSLTMSAKDSNPETILIGAPLDSTKNPTTTKLGDALEDITGVVTNTYGFYTILPLTAIKIKTPSALTPPPTSLVSSGSCKGLTVGTYNVENLAPTSAHMPKVASQIVTYLKSPDLLFIQEVQDNTGATDDGVVSANKTLATLISAIKSAGGPIYDYVTIEPVNDEDGGQPGGNIRTAYLYNPSILSLKNPNPGSSTDANEVIVDAETGQPSLKFNPGRVDPLNAAWKATRKPLVAEWIAKDGKKPFFTVNVHMTSKGGGSSVHGDVRPPINGGVEKRTQQAEITAKFISQILQADPAARVIAAGDFNEFAFVKPLTTFAEVSGLKELDEALNTPVENRYTYSYDMNAQALDHMYISPVLASSKSKFQHIHVSSWVTDSAVVSDHDPSVALFDVCGCADSNKRVHKL
ncbi:Endonuclease/exonuclease/phosphatase [Neurospora hispaniola]|uniref:Endonuclease/exonuclease/phosphatase n=1 Tax=Neurospora hispaniola TaxID=588809 RepID=A0AAJ0I8A3_9PEZI|nr:Endonuclease/exonuclease/phosphatase [Neurospora hispaniola]